MPIVAIESRLEFGAADPPSPRLTPGGIDLRFRLEGLNEADHVARGVESRLFQTLFKTRPLFAGRES